MWRKFADEAMKVLNSNDNQFMSVYEIMEAIKKRDPEAFKNNDDPDTHVLRDMRDSGYFEKVHVENKVAYWWLKDEFFTPAPEGSPLAPAADSPPAETVAAEKPPAETTPPEAKATRQQSQSLANKPKREVRALDNPHAVEGYKRHVLREVTYRNQSLPALRKRIDDKTCQVCGFRLVFELEGVEISVIDCHHLDPLKDGETTTPIDRLVCLCPNCHRLAHITDPPLGLEELRSYVGKYREQRTVPPLPS